MYLSYEEYNELGGNTSTLDETTFNQLEFEARAIIDWWTFNRLQKEESYPEAVKRCMFKLISLILSKQQAMALSTDDSSVGNIVAPGIAQESNDGVSTSYNTLSAKEAVDSLQKEFQDTVQLYLGSVKNSLGHRVLYRGVYPNE